MGYFPTLQNAFALISCTNTAQYSLNEVVICHTGACGNNGTFSLSRSASLSSTVTFQTEGINFCIDPSDKCFIDFGNGRGFRMAQGAAIVINYPPSSTTDPSVNIKKIKIRKGRKGVVYETDFMVKSLTSFVCEVFLLHIFLKTYKTNSKWH